MSTDLTKPIEYLDEETGEIVTIPVELTRMHIQFHNYEERDVIKKAFTWKWFRDTEGYRSFGCETFKQYCEEISTHNYNTLRQYLTIGDAFFPVLNIVDMNQVQAPALLEGAISENDEAKHLSKLGYEKLREIAKMGDDKVNEVINQKQITFDDGTVITYQEIEDATTRDLKEDFKAERKRLQDEIKEREAELNKAEVARDKAIAEKERIEEQSKEGMVYQQKYDRTATTHSAYKKRLQAIRDAWLQLNSAIYQCQELPTIFDDLMEEARDLNLKIQGSAQSLRDNNMYAFADNMLSSYRDELSGDDLEYHDHYMEHGMSPDMKEYLDHEDQQDEDGDSNQLKRVK